MIISRTPFRISFFGGGTDYPSWFETEKGAVLATSIDKYCYVSCRALPPFFPHKHRIVYSKIENVEAFEDIVHPTVRECLRYLEIDCGTEIHHDADLPARAGLGSSSAFTVGLLNVLHALKGNIVDKMSLVRQAIHVERDLARENVGCQDQTAAAFGGLQRIEFSPGDDISPHPLALPAARRELLQDHLMLYFTGFTRLASEIAGEQLKNMERNRRQLLSLYGMVDEAVGFLSDDKGLQDFGRLLHEAWMLKRSLAHSVSNEKIDGIYERGRKAGALGGKLLGAGGGGFLLLFVEPDLQPQVEQELQSLLRVPFKFENRGTQIIFYD